MGGGVNNSIGRGEANELTHVTHGHEIRGGGIAGRKGDTGRREKGKKSGQLNQYNQSNILKNKNKTLQKVPSNFGSGINSSAWI